MVDRFQRERGIKVDLILQCGDLGCFPDLDKLDTATIKHAKRDPDELGFRRHFLYANKEVETLINRVNCDMVCVRGNHEDHDWLDELEKASPFPSFSIDPYQRIWVLKTGHLQQFGEGESQLNVVGIGRVGDRKGRTSGKFIQPYEQEALRRLNPKKQRVDVLVSHDSPADSVTKGFGMAELRTFLDRHKPQLHFFGHIGPEFESFADKNGVTECYKPGELVFKHHGELPRNCMLLLDWNGPYDFSVEAVTDGWLDEYRRETWGWM